jgi:hypothetical protein
MLKDKRREDKIEKQSFQVILVNKGNTREKQILQGG